MMFSSSLLVTMITGVIGRNSLIRGSVSSPVSPGIISSRITRSVSYTHLFALIATLAVGDKKSGDEKFIPLFDLIETASADPRNFVRKAVNWALRQTGKRNLRLHTQAVALSRRLGASADRTAAWIGRDALRELSDPKIIARIKP